MKKIVLSLMMCLSAMGAMAADTFTDSAGNTYEITKAYDSSNYENGECRLVSLANPGKEVNLSSFVSDPNSMNWATYTLTAIGEKLLAGNSTVERIDIPYTVTELGDSCFAGMTALTFIDCGITTPKAIDESVFEGDVNATLFVSESALSSYKSTDGWNTVATILPLSFVQGSLRLTFITAKTLAVKNAYTDSEKESQGDVVIPATATVEDKTFDVAVISANAFSNCTKITSITIPASVDSIGAKAFNGCTALDSVNVSWTTPLAISDNVFSGLTLQNIDLTVPEASAEAYRTAPVWKFFRVNGVASTATYDTFTTDGVTYYKVSAPAGYDNGVAAVAPADYTGAVTIPATVSDDDDNEYSVKTIAKGAFKDCAGLTSVTLPKLSAIEDSAFAGCTGLTMVNIVAAQSSLPKLSATAFDQTTYDNATLLVDADALADVKEADGWKNFKHIIPNKFTEGVLSYEFNSDMTLAVGYAMDDNWNVLTKGAVVIPETVSYGGNDYTVTTIGDGAFAWSCYDMTSISIPATVTSIADQAFANASALDTVYVNWQTPLAVTGEPFYGVGKEDRTTWTYDLSAVTLVVPDGTADAYKAVEPWKNFNVVEKSVVTAINRTQATVANGRKEYFSLSGEKLGTMPAQGVCIVRDARGARKVVIRK